MIISFDHFVGLSSDHFVGLALERIKFAASVDLDLEAQ